MALSFLVDDIPVELRLNARRRTRIAVNIDPAGHVVLDAPEQTAPKDAEALVREHARWLRYRIKAVREETAHLRRMGYLDGEVVPFLGDSLVLRLYEGDQAEQRGNELLVPMGDEENTRRLVRGWYSDQAALILPEIIEQYRTLPWLEGRLPKWRHRFMKSQWGSCSAKGTISLNTHLVRTPRSLIEYVVLHELCHIKHHDHSRRFHALMSAHMPDWPQRSKALRRHISLLLDE